MATLTADAGASLNQASSEERCAPAEITAFGWITIVSGGVLLLVVAAIAKAASVAGSEDSLERFWHAFLFGTTYAASLSLGGLFFVIAHHLTGGRWATSLRRLAEIVAGAMPYAALLFLPILGNLVLTDSGSLYKWDNPAIVAGDAVLEHKAGYLNDKWFVIRNGIYLTIFVFLASVFVGGSVKQDRSGSVASLRRLSRLSGPAMLVFGLALNFAAFDWLMSLAPHWFSTIFGVYFFAGSIIAFLALLLLLAIGLQQLGVLTESITTDNLHDASKLMYAMIVFWGYIAFSQFLLIWYANVPEETEWYFDRQGDQATYFGIPWSLGALFVLHLFVPFLGFMSRAVRRNKAAMVFWASYMLVVHALDLAFIVLPGGAGYEGYSIFGMIGFYEIACLVGALAVVAGAVLRGAEDKWLLPLRDPRLQQAMTYHNH
ncbi:MAG: quinol:cytochrome C oxidoreductase [Planctomycetota bacterium]